MVEPDEALAAIGVLPDAEIDPAPAALQLARLDRPDEDWRETSAHLSVLAREAVAIGAIMAGRSGEARIGALAGTLHARHGYGGDTETYDDLANANLIAVVRRRRGLPVALGILWLHCIRAAGWDAHGIDFPGHFLLALRTSPSGSGVGHVGREPARLLIDPFAQGATLGSADLLSRVAPAQVGGTAAQPGLALPMTTRGVLLRLQRNVVQRRLGAGALDSALRALEGMLLIAPDVTGNWFDAADINRRLGRIGKAGRCLEHVIEMAPDSESARLARRKLDELGPR